MVKPNSKYFGKDKGEYDKEKKIKKVEKNERAKTKAKLKKIIAEENFDNIDFGDLDGKIG